MSEPIIWTPARVDEAEAALRSESVRTGAFDRVARMLSDRWGFSITPRAIGHALKLNNRPRSSQLIGTARNSAPAQNVSESSVSCEPRVRHPLEVSRAAPRDAIPPPPRRPTERILVIPDVHVPYHDERAWNVALAVAKKMRPDTIVLVGDFCDAYAVSSFPKSPERRQSLKWEIEQADKELSKLEGLSGRTVFCEGNHEYRLERFLCQRAPELYGLVTISDLLRIKARGWEWVPYKQWIRIGKTAFSHEVGHYGKYAMQQSLASFGGNIVFGHSHRAGTHYDGTIDGDHRFAMNVGWLGDATQTDYAHRSQTRAWQQGVGIVDQDQNGNSWAQFCPIVGGRVSLGGELVAA